MTTRKESAQTRAEASGTHLSRPPALSVFRTTPGFRLPEVPCARHMAHRAVPGSAGCFQGQHGSLWKRLEQGPLTVRPPAGVLHTLRRGHCALWTAGPAASQLLLVSVVFASSEHISFCMFTPGTRGNRRGLGHTRCPSVHVSQEGMLRPGPERGAGCLRLRGLHPGH